MEDKEILLEDDATKVIVNAEGDTANVNPEVKALLEYIKSQKVESDFVKDINNAVSEAIDHKEWRDEYMTFAMRLNEERAEERAKTLYELVQSGDLTIEKAADKLNVTVDQLKSDMVEKGYIVL